jgi:hypothetical protein
MAIATNAMKEALAIEYGSLALYASLHTADPGTTGTSEVAGGSPAYARKSLTWTAGSSITHAGIFSASTSGTFYDKVAVTYNSQPSQGQLTVNFTYTQS